MAESDPRLEFRPGPGVRHKLEELRREISKKIGHTVSMSELITAIIEQFLFEEEKR